MVFSLSLRSFVPSFLRSFVLLIVLVDISAALSQSTAPTINNTVSSTIAPGLATWDPGHELTVAGQIRRSVHGPNRCTDLGSYPYIFKTVGIETWPSSSPALGPGHNSCAGYPFSSGEVGLDGNFSFTLKGGGSSWSAGDGTLVLGSIMEAQFGTADMIDYRYVLCGKSSDYPVLSEIACPSAPEIYGRLASPDLNGNLAVDMGDLSAFAAVLGLPITLVSGWQADFNHSGGTVDAGDLSYFVGRLGKNCASAKSTDGDYAMDVRNLADPTVLQFITEHDMNPASVIAHWEEMNLSYDREAARSVTADDLSERGSWSNFKTLYRE